MLGLTRSICKGFLSSSAHSLKAISQFIQSIFTDFITNKLFEVLGYFYYEEQKTIYQEDASINQFTLFPHLP